MNTARVLFTVQWICFCALLFPGAARTQPVTPSPAAEEFNAPAPSTAPAIPASARPVGDPNYLLEPDDVVEVAVFREPDLTTDGMIRKDGSFDMKLIGQIKMTGLTLDQAGEAVRAALARDYLVNPRVSLEMIAYAKRKVNVLGEVRSPGIYSFPPRGPLLLGDAIALAGGFLPSADAARVIVRRLENNREVTLTAGGNDAEAFALRPDDAITVAVLAKRHFTVLGQVTRPGTYEMPDDRPVYLTDAIAVAGGFTRIANPAKVLLKRTESGGRETVLNLNAEAMANSPATQRVQLQDEDTITVTERLF